MSEVLISYTLQHPLEIKVGKGEQQVVADTITKVDVKRPKGRNMKAMGKGQTLEDKMCLFIGSCIGVPQAAMDDLDWDDLTALEEILRPFFEKFLRILQTSTET